MNATAHATGIIIISHGSPREVTNQGFVGLVARIAARLGVPQVLPAFFSIARPNIADQVAVLNSQGLRHIVLMPYFLYSGQHVTTDIPALLDQCRQQFPQLALEFLPTLENDPALEDVVVERLTPLATTGTALPGEGAAIERRSYEIIDQQLTDWGGADPGARAMQIDAMNEFGRRLGEGEEAPSQRAAHFLLDFIGFGARPPEVGSGSGRAARPLKF